MIMVTIKVDLEWYCPRWRRPPGAHCGIHGSKTRFRVKVVVAAAAAADDVVVVFLRKRVEDDWFVEEEAPNQI